MPPVSTTLVGRYRLDALLGAGGMGEVYRGYDERLGRTVAVKVIKNEVVADPSYRERLLRESRTIAAVSHPHICAVHDSGEHQGAPFIVMEHLEGQTLAARLERGPLKDSEALQYAIQIAGALARAHAAGITHRDLKPRNIMLTPGGAKLLDFGLARLRSGGPAACEQTNTLPITSEHAIIGTLHYMAPEQLEGRQADARSDIFAFGCVLYEMLTGVRAFEGSSQASVMAAILEHDPARVSSMRRTNPSGLEWIVEQCLNKNPDLRWQNARDLEIELSRNRPPMAVESRKSRIWPYVAGVAALLALPLTVYLLRSAPSTPRSEIRFEVFPPIGTTFTNPHASVPATQLAVSPDGRWLAFVASERGQRSAIWVRGISNVEPAKLTGTDRATYPFWSPDSQNLAFFADGSLKRIARTGGVAQVLTDAASDPRGGAWGADDTIVFSGVGSGPLSSISGTGGPVVPVTRLDPQKHEVSHRWPHFLSDGRSFLYTVRANTGKFPVLLGSVGGGTPPVEVTQSTWFAEYLPRGRDGYLVFSDAGALVARKMDRSTHNLDGGRRLIAENVGGSSTGYAAFSVAANGTIAYAPTQVSMSTLTWVDRAGRSEKTVGQPADYIDFRLSPDETKVAASTVEPAAGSSDIWLVDLTRGTTSRLTFTPFTEASPVWSPDGSRLVFRSNRLGVSDWFEKVLGESNEKLVFSQEKRRVVHGQNGVFIPSDWSPDGRSIVYCTFAQNGYEIWTFPLDQGQAPVPVTRGQFFNAHPNISPNGKWVAYDSNESGRSEVYVRAYDPAAAAQNWLISPAGGTEPRWRADGRELFYLTPDGHLASVAVRADDRFEAKVPEQLFQTNLTLDGNPYRQHYVPSRDGKRFW